jgi:hypothetical protein
MDEWGYLTCQAVLPIIMMGEAGLNNCSWDIAITGDNQL